MAAEVNYVTHTVTARKTFQCWDCPRTIAKGEDYARHAAFPGHDCCGGDRPRVLKLCRACHTQYGKPMPPRKPSRSPRLPWVRSRPRDHDEPARASPRARVVP